MHSDYNWQQQNLYPKCECHSCTQYRKSKEPLNYPYPYYPAPPIEYPPIPQNPHLQGYTVSCSGVISSIVKQL